MRVTDGGSGSDSGSDVAVDCQMCGNVFVVELVWRNMRRGSMGCFEPSV